MVLGILNALYILWWYTKRIETRHRLFGFSFFFLSYNKSLKQRMWMKSSFIHEKIELTMYIIQWSAILKLFSCEEKLKKMQY